eukprot:256733_1
MLTPSVGPTLITDRRVRSGWYSVCLRCRSFMFLILDDPKQYSSACFRISPNGRNGNLFGCFKFLNLTFRVSPLEVHLSGRGTSCRFPAEYDLHIRALTAALRPPVEFELMSGNCNPFDNLINDPSHGIQTHFHEF